MSGAFHSLSVREVVHAYGESKVLNNISFDLQPGKSYAILGPNGSGKTTLFHILTTAMFPTFGRVLWNGKDLSTCLVPARNAMGVVFQVPSLDRKLTVLENLRYQGALFGLSSGVLEERIAKVLKKFAIALRANDLVETLSGGLARRVEIAKSLLHDPDLLLMDEPSSSLDPVARMELRSVVSDLVQEGKTVVLTTHLLDEADGCDENLILHEGRLVAQGTPTELKSAIDRKIVFIKSKDMGSLSSELADSYGVPIAKVEGALRIEVPMASDFVQSVLKSHASDIDELTYRSPTLEDVFIHYANANFHGREV